MFLVFFSYDNKPQTIDGPRWDYYVFGRDRRDLPYLIIQGGQAEQDASGREPTSSASKGHGKALVSLLTGYLV
jgi:hypothetical protein